MLRIPLSVSPFFACSVAGLPSYISDGRKPVYMICLPLLCIGSFGTAFSRNISNLMMWRFVQAFGASPGVSVGGGVISDIYKLEERGTAMGTYFAVSCCSIWCMLATYFCSLGMLARTSACSANRRYDEQLLAHNIPITHFVGIQALQQRTLPGGSYRSHWA